jgi:ribosomal protein S26
MKIKERIEVALVKDKGETSIYGAVAARLFLIKIKIELCIDCNDT